MADVVAVEVELVVAELVNDVVGVELSEDVALVVAVVVDVVVGVVTLQSEKLPS